MTIATIREKIHHGNYINVRVGVLPALDAESLDHFMAGNPYHAGPIKADQVAQVLDDLTNRGRGELGWATYTLRELPEATRCEYYALCDNRAVGVVSHPVIPFPVPVCQRCADKHNLEVVKFSQAEPAAPVEIGTKFTLVRESSGDVKMIDPFDLAGDDTPDRNLWAVETPEDCPEHDRIIEGCEDCDPDFRVIPGPQARNGNILYYFVSKEEWSDEDKEITYVY